MTDSLKATPEPIAQEATHVSLSGNQDVRTAADLQRQLTDLLATKQFVVLDGTELQSIDAACLQLLLAAKREAQEKLQIMIPSDHETIGWIQYSGLANLLLCQ